MSNVLDVTNSPEAIARAIADTAAGSFSGGESTHLCKGCIPFSDRLLGMGVPARVGVYSDGTLPDFPEAVWVPLSVVVLRLRAFASQFVI